MKIGGLQKFSLIDFPGRFSAIVFAQGCNFRCPFCHNPELVLPEKFGPCIPEKEVFDFLKKRVGQLEGVVITGGEPTIQPNLESFIREIKELGFAVKLDTNGSNPQVLERLLSWLDYVAMDIKGPPKKYPKISGAQVGIAAVRRSVGLIMSSDLDYEFRTTFVKPLLEVEDFQEIGLLVSGAKRFALQKFVLSKHIRPDFPFEAPSDIELQGAKKILLNFVEEVVIRE